jgi:hypothetical protein
LWLRNQTAESREFTLSVNLPPGWTLQTGSLKFLVGAKQMGTVRLEVNLPALGDPPPKNAEPQEVSVHAEANGLALGDVKMRVELRKRALQE